MIWTIGSEMDDCDWIERGREKSVADIDRDGGDAMASTAAFLGRSLRCSVFDGKDIERERAAGRTYQGQLRGRRWLRDGVRLRKEDGGWRR